MSIQDRIVRKGVEDPIMRCLKGGKEGESGITFRSSLANGLGRSRPSSTIFDHLRHVSLKLGGREGGKGGREQEGEMAAYDMGER